MRYSYPAHTRIGLFGVMVMIVIIGVIALIALTNYLSWREGVKESEVKSNARLVQVAAEDYAYRNDWVYPSLSQMQTTSLFPGGENTIRNPFTDDLETVTSLHWERGRIGYGISGLIYTIEGYGDTSTSGPAGDGVIIRLTNGSMRLMG